MLKISVTYQLSSALRDNGDGQTMSSSICTGITYTLSLRNSERSLLSYSTIGLNSLKNVASQLIGPITITKLKVS